jgi:hypothetical protein
MSGNCFNRKMRVKNDETTITALEYPCPHVTIFGWSNKNNRKANSTKASHFNYAKPPLSCRSAFPFLKGAILGPHDVPSCYAGTYGCLDIFTKGDIVDTDISSLIQNTTVLVVIVLLIPKDSLT